MKNALFVVAKIWRVCVNGLGRLGTREHLGTRAGKIRKSFHWRESLWIDRAQKRSKTESIARTPRTSSTITLLVREDIAVSDLM